MSRVERGPNGQNVFSELDPVGLYFKDIGSVSVPTPKEVRRLSAEIFVGYLSLRALGLILASGELPPDQREHIEKLFGSNRARFLVEQVDLRLTDVQGKADSNKDESDRKFAAAVQNHGRWLAEQINGFGPESNQDKQLPLGRLIDNQLALAQRGLASHRRLVEGNLRLVVSLACYYQGQGLGLDDLIQYGVEGLMVAAAKFDFRKGWQFSTYATPWIKQTVRRGVQYFGGPVRLPVNIHERLARIKRRAAELTQQTGAEVSPHKVGQYLGFSQETMAAVTRFKSLLSLNRVVDDEEGTELGDFVPDRDNNVEEQIYQLEIRNIVRKVLGSLDHKEMQVLVMRLGLDDGLTKTLDEIGEEFNVTRERIRQIEARALRKLRRPQILAQLDQFRDEDPRAVKTNVAKELAVKGSPRRPRRPRQL